MPTSPDLTSLGCALDLLHGLAMHRVFPYLAGTLHGGDLSFSQFNALYQLHHDGALTIAGLAKTTDLSHNAASRMVEGLVSAGFAERREDLRDRRQDAALRNIAADILAGQQGQHAEMMKLLAEPGHEH